MSTYSCSAHSNFFRVNDVPKFKRFCRRWSLTSLAQTTTPGDTRYAFDTDEEGVPDEERFVGQLAALLVPGEIAIVKEIGYERRTLVGFALAVNSDGATVTVQLSDIEKLAKDRLGSTKVA